MGDLFTVLSKRAHANAQRIVDTCNDELPEYRATVSSPDGYARMLDFAVFIRQRTLELVSSDQPLTDDDLTVVSTIGEERGRKGMPHAILHRVLALHATATLREIHEASGPKDLNEAMHMLAWLGPQGSAGQQAYILGFLQGQQHRLPLVARVRQFADMALAGDPTLPRYALEVGIPLADQYRVIVIRIPGDPEPSDTQAGGILNAIWQRHQVPATLQGPGQLVALVPADQDAGAMALVRDVAEIIGRPCAVGTATGPAYDLADTAVLARRVSQAARTETTPSHLHTVADLFIELGVSELPELDRWLRHLAQRLATGPDLLTTLDAYYRHELNRARTAAALNIHPRTLDYRLTRARELAGMDPHSTHGIRVLSTVVTRAAGSPST